VGGMNMELTLDPEIRDQADKYWATHGKDIKITVTPWRQPEQVPFEWFYEDQRRENPWCNGRYALASIVWGLIIMLVWSLSI
jgi:hypothetical protein